ncbi:MAG: carboxypeptidase-like regulatory domain-containing protein, partial [Gemmatimonadales bacterium]
MRVEVRSCLPAGVLALLLFNVPAFSQEVTGNIEGRVLSTDGDPVSAAVRVDGPSLQAVRTVQSDERGWFRVFRLPVGEYTVRLSALGHRAVVVEAVR